MVAQKKGWRANLKRTWLKLFHLFLFWIYKTNNFFQLIWLVSAWILWWIQVLFQFMPNRWVQEQIHYYNYIHLTNTVLEGKSATEHILGLRNVQNIFGNPTMCSDMGRFSWHPWVKNITQLAGRSLQIYSLFDLDNWMCSSLYCEQSDAPILNFNPF